LAIRRVRAATSITTWFGGSPEHFITGVSCSIAYSMLNRRNRYDFDRFEVLLAVSDIVDNVDW